MKGMLLFVRPVTPEDEPRLRSFWKSEAREPFASAPGGLIGFLLGDLVASLSFEPAGEQLLIRDFWVARNLRRKRIARTMLAELDEEARRLGSLRLVIRTSTEFVDAFHRLGFTEGSGGLLVRPVERVR